jgi:hypothetical protein
MGESVFKALNKEKAARKHAIRTRYSCSVPGSLRDVRFRVERKEITGKSERDVFYTVAYCLRPSGMNRCVWKVWDHDSDTPFENVQRAVQKSVPAPEQSAATAPEQSTPAPASKRPEPWDEGWTASQAGDANPYPTGSPDAKGWDTGWRAHEAASAAAPAPEQSTAARAPEQSAPTPAPEQPRGWTAVVKKSRPICASADDYVQFHRTSFDIARLPSRKVEAAMQKAIEFVKRKCPIAKFEPGDHANVERTETFSIDKTNSITLACVVIKDGPCAWTDASQLVRISEEAPAKKSTQSRAKSAQDAFEERPEQPAATPAKAARPRRGKRGNR